MLYLVVVVSFLSFPRPLPVNLEPLGPDANVRKSQKMTLNKRNLRFSCAKKHLNSMFKF